ncbi:TPA: glycosyltransferase family 2 protein [Streptococcus agalactiae]|nr:glycosyltransferase family 2 protein [Streptococcus agalactiae]HEO2292117.1 glycosyltransferase family 2 protein [Streptococcus agalactiae]HEO3877703.1 glycosyltransferase family 2 protein [Streptococcus agalactiae]
MTDKLVSVIIPVYNAAPYLEGCVNTILGQTYQVFEILLIDDGSTDTSASICDQLSLRDNCIRVFHIENGGASKARNFGLARISPESQFVTFVDSDDWVKENYLEVLLAQQEKYNADIVISNYYIYRETEDIFGYYITDKDFVIEEISAQTAIDRQVHWHLNSSVFIVIWGKLYRRELFDTITFPIDKVFEDELVSVLLFIKSKKTILVNGSYYGYRIRPNSIMTSAFSSKRAEDLIYIFDSKLSEIILSGLDSTATVERYFWLMRDYKQRLEQENLQKTIIYKVISNRLSR